MEESILKSTKKMLGIEEDVTAFDLEITTDINSALSHLHQLGIGNGAPIDSDDTAEWEQLGLTDQFLNMVKTFIFLKVKSLFDPPSTSYLLEATEKQISEHEHRLVTYAEVEFS